MTKYLLCLFVLLPCYSLAAFSQNKFEGYNIIVDVPRDHRQATCAVRYAPQNAVITVTDLDSSTPLDIKACEGSGTTLIQSAVGSATFRANAATNRWCFSGKDKRYRISFSGDNFSGPITYNWITETDPRESGFLNIRDFGAVGDGRTDDTAAFRSAMAYIASKNGGTLNIPDGEYIVSGPVALPSGLVLQGTNGLQSLAATSAINRNNPARITLTGQNRSLFTIGECVENVVIRDIELYAQSNVNTNGIEAFGAYMSAQGFHFDRVTFNNFNRGIYAYGLPQTQLEWQVDYVNLNACRFIYNRDAGIHVNVKNTNWKIEAGLFINPRAQPGQNADSMHFERAGSVIIQNTFGGGFPQAKGGTYLKMLDTANITIIGSQTEAMNYSIVYNETNNPLAGDYSYPITIVNSVFGEPIVFNARRTLVSTGTLYGGNVFRADERLRVYSTGDRFCYDGNILGCVGSREANFDRATVVFMTGQPADGKVRGHPTYFGTDVDFGAPVRMPSFPQNALPPGRQNGSMVYCQNCRRSTTPCQAGGSGAPAMVVNGQWSCL
ncbi:MAG TPA: glycosyl hydrolase family 28-related protein [Pyrinomonadaceae bacterium]|nr:glycosyl hydrolase family 28-related protein [Pyrinomonadaceae bacterium]HMP66699.1 glycosyl hydrolase family 28-related protein [Pyrinomonadaceae bacterium]